jgi:hypothetical protein
MNHIQDKLVFSKKKIRKTSSSTSNVKGKFNFMRHYIALQLHNLFYFRNKAYNLSGGEIIKYAQEWV